MIEQLPDLTAALSTDLTAALSTDLAAVIAAAPEGAQAGYVDGQKILDSAAGNINRAADWVAIVLLLLGVGFSFLSTVGLLRMPDLYTRMQAAAKAGTLGMACTILAVAAHFAPTPAGPGVLVTTLLIMIFIFMTTPAASHLIGRAAYVTDTPLWERTAHDELDGCYCGATHRLAPSPDVAAGERFRHSPPGEDGERPRRTA